MKIIINFLLKNQKRIRIALFVIIFLMVVINIITCIILQKCRPIYFLSAGIVYFLAILIFLENFIILKLKNKTKIIAKLTKYFLYFIKYFSIFYLCYFLLLLHIIGGGLAGLPFLCKELFIVFIPLLSLLLL